MPFSRLLDKLLFANLFFLLPVFCSSQVVVHALPSDHHEIQRCGTMKALDEAIRKNPGIVEIWRKNGEMAYQKYLQRKATQRGSLTDTVVIPVVFHLVDISTKLASVTDRTIYDQVEILNEAYNGIDIEKYKDVIPRGMYNRKGAIPLKFVLARRRPDGTLTSGIERRANTTPDHISIKSSATGGLDAWDTDKYLNVWLGTFSGDDDGLLGIATFPFTTTEGPQGVVVGISTLPYTSFISRGYYPAYSEGKTLVHEIGHYFYLYHTFGDSFVCNNNDFRIQPGWPLPAGAGPEGDDTPEEKADSEGNAHYGNPSMDYSDGCTVIPEGEMYGSFMNYFDDRALFMFSNGHKNRVMGCIDLYRPNLANSIGATPPASVTDAYVVSMSPYGAPITKSYILNNVPLNVKIRNYGTTTINSVTVTVVVDGSIKYQQTINPSLLPGRDADISLGNINTTAGDHAMTVFTSNPNGSTDAFSANDTLQSFFTVVNQSVDAPFAENFSSATFPPAGWQIWNPDGDATWSFSSTSGYSAAGSATMQNYNSNAIGTLDELVMPSVNVGSADSSILSFRYAYATYDEKDVSTWDGLEIYLSNDDGLDYHLIYKKTGTFLRSVIGNTTSAFAALPSNPEKWGYEQINLSPYIVSGKKFLIKFRAVNAWGNNLYLDDINVSAIVSLNRDLEMSSITNIPQYLCDVTPAPSISFVSNGKDPVTSLKINYQINNQAVQIQNWTGLLYQNGVATVSLPALPALPAGDYIFKVYTSAPNGQADEAPMNDTMRFRFYVMGHQTNPVTESFESGQFPPDQWVIQQNGNGHTWERVSLAASDGVSSAVIKNFNYDMLGMQDNVISPIISGNGGYDSLFLSFDYAYGPGINYPGAPGDREDTLDVKITTDCGQSFTSIFRKFGNEMVTVPDPMASRGIYFVPGNDDWKHISVYMTPVSGSKDFQVFFSSKGNNRNNIYIDNIRVFGINVPPLLKEKGYLFYPSPFKDQFIIRNYEQPVSLRNVQIYNAAGQLVWRQQYNGNAYKQIFVNAAGWAPGVYTVKMSFTNKTIIDRVVKQ